MATRVFQSLSFHVISNPFVHSFPHSFQFTSFQHINNSYKQTGSYSHVLFSKLPPWRVPGTGTWYPHLTQYLHLIISSKSVVNHQALQQLLITTPDWSQTYQPQKKNCRRNLVSLGQKIASKLWVHLINYNDYTLW